MRLLIIEDEKDLLDALLRGFAKLGYSADGAEDGLEGFHMARETEYDLIILDLNLPGMDGLDILSNIRKENSDQKILILSARTHYRERILGLDLGANDYLVKPFDFGELDARVRNLLRRSFTQSKSVLSLGGLEVDTVQKEVRNPEGSALELSPKEFSILEYLMLNRGKPVSAETLIEHIWGNEGMFSNAVKVHVSLLRKKLTPYLKDGAIRNIRGAGYIIEEAGF